MLLKLKEEIKRISGENIDLCNQCGECSSGCPMASRMDLLPPMVTKLVQLEDIKVLESDAIWLCVSCYTCTARCPRGLNLASVIGALRQIALRGGIRALQLVKFEEEKYDYVGLKERKLPLIREELDILPQFALVKHLMHTQYSREL